MTGPPPARAWTGWSALCGVLLLLLWGPRIGVAVPLADEKVYVAAVHAVATGVPLTEVHGWYYPDPVAHLGALVVAAIGELPSLWGLRGLNLLGLSVSLGWMLARLPRGWAALVLGACMVSPMVRSACTAGNISGILVGLLCGSLVGRPDRWGAPLVMLSFLLKPYGLVRALDLPGISRVLALGTAGLAWVFTSNRGALINLDSVRNAAPARALLELGLPVPWPLWTGVVLLWAAWRRPSGARALAAGWLCLPLSWDHTALLAVPLLGDALVGPRPVAGELRLARILVVLAAVVLADTGGFGTAEGPRWLSGLIGLIPAGAVLFLLWVTAPEAQRGVKPTA